MPRKPASQLKLDRIQAAIQPLTGLPQWDDFVEVLRDLKEEAVANSVNFDTVGSERKSLVSKGEVLCYINILGVCDSQKEQFDAEEQARVEQLRANQS
jgi:hypothetical protein